MNMDDEPQLDDDSFEDSLGESRAARAATAVMHTVNKVVRDGIGPVSGSAKWAESRLRAIQGGNV